MLQPISVTRNVAILYLNVAQLYIIIIIIISIHHNCTLTLLLLFFLFILSLPIIYWKAVENVSMFIHISVFGFGILLFVVGGVFC